MTTKLNDSISIERITLPPRYDLTPRVVDVVKERRPYKFKPEVKRKVLVALQMGHYPSTAASYAKIKEETLVKWWKRGQLAGPESEGLDKELYEFYEQCQEARAKGKVGLVGILWKHARNDGHVAIKLLEKLYPEEYGKKVEHSVTGKVSHEHKKVDYSDFTDAELEEMERLALKAQKEQAIDAEIVERGD